MSFSKSKVGLVLQSLTPALFWENISGKQTTKITGFCMHIMGEKVCCTVYQNYASSQDFF